MPYYSTLASPLSRSEVCSSVYVSSTVLTRRFSVVLSNTSYLKDASTRAKLWIEQDDITDVCASDAYRTRRSMFKYFLLTGAYILSWLCGQEIMIRSQRGGIACEITNGLRNSEPSNSSLRTLASWSFSYYLIKFYRIYYYSISDNLLKSSMSLMMDLSLSSSSSLRSISS